jgi:2-oxo-3-hexenedioate decarboxylase/2-keto-4-pentenoate hydratase
MTREHIDEAVAALIADRDANREMGPWPERWRPTTPEDAYAIQDAVHARRAEMGQVIGGWKIGCTTPVMQEMLGIPMPCAGGVLAGAIHASTAELRFADFFHPMAECEIAVTLASDIPPRAAGHDRESVSAHVGACHAAMEVAEGRYKDRAERNAAEFIADDFFQKAVVLGPEVADWQAIGLAAIRGVTTVAGEAKGDGIGGDVMGHPLNALAWLADHLATRGRSLKAGEVVLTGSVVIATPIEAGKETVCGLEGLGEARLTLT